MYEAEYEYIQFGTIENINNEIETERKIFNTNINELPISTKISIIPSPVIPIIIARHIVNTNVNNLTQSNVCFIKKTYKFIFSHNMFYSFYKYFLI